MHMHIHRPLLARVPGISDPMPRSCQSWGFPSYSPLRPGPSPFQTEVKKNLFFFGHQEPSRAFKKPFKIASHFRHRFLMAFGSNLAPTWPQLAPNLEPKSFQNPSQEPSKTHPKSHHILNDFLDGFLMDFWRPKPSKINQKSITNSTQQHNNHSIEKPINLVTVLRFL